MKNEKNPGEIGPLKNEKKKKDIVTTNLLKNEIKSIMVTNLDFQLFKKF